MSVPKTPTSLDPGPPGTFTWKGLNWVKRQGGAGSPGVSAWVPEHVVLNSDGSITFRLTPQGGCEMSTTRKGFGYGDYWIVTETPLDRMAMGVTWGSLFSYDTEMGGSHNEIDMQETGAWGRPGTPTVSPHHWGPNGEDLQYGSSFPAPNGPMCSHMRWEPGRITYWTYAGTTDSAPLIKTTVTTDRVPTPRQEKLLINLWQFKAGMQPINTKVLDVAFVPLGTTPQPPTPPISTPITPSS